MTAADRAARSEHGDGPALGEEARRAVQAALVTEMGCGDPATPQGRQDLHLLGEMADGVLYALRPHVAALLAQARAVGAAEVDRLRRQLAESERLREIQARAADDRSAHIAELQRQLGPCRAAIIEVHRLASEAVAEIRS